MQAKAEGERIGLKNVGNTCYFNSLLQTYFSIPKFRYDVSSCEALQTRHSRMSYTAYRVICARSKPAGSAITGSSPVLRSQRQDRKAFFASKRCPVNLLALCKRADSDKLPELLPDQAAETPSGLCCMAKLPDHLPNYTELPDLPKLPNLPKQAA